MLHHIYIERIAEALIPVGLCDAFGIPIWETLESLAFHRRQFADAEGSY